MGGGERTAAAVRASAEAHVPRWREGAPCARANSACAPPPGAIKASPPAATSASSCREKSVHLLQRQLLWTWTLRPALALLAVPAPATKAPASARDANAPPARRVSVGAPHPTPPLPPVLPTVVCLRKMERPEAPYYIAFDSYWDRTTWGDRKIQSPRPHPQ